MRMDFALLIIDVLVDFFERVPELSAQRARLVAATNQLTEAVRGAGQPVIWVRQEFRPDLSDAFLDMRRRGVAVTIAGTEGSKILPELKQAASDYVVVQNSTRAFYGTGRDGITDAL